MPLSEGAQNTRAYGHFREKAAHREGDFTAVTIPEEMAGQSREMGSSKQMKIISAQFIMV